MLLESRDFYHCTYCHKNFGMRSDSSFCNVECQTNAAGKIDRVARDRKPKPVAKSSNIFSEENVSRVNEEKKVVEKPWVFSPQKDFDERWAKYRKLVSMKD